MSCYDIRPKLKVCTEHNDKQTKRIKHVAQLSQTDRAAGWLFMAISERLELGDNIYGRDIIGLPSTTVTYSKWLGHTLAFTSVNAYIPDSFTVCVHTIAIRLSVWLLSNKAIDYTEHLTSDEQVQRRRSAFGQRQNFDKKRWREVFPVDQQRARVGQRRIQDPCI